MALLLTTESATGFVAENAYHRVEMPQVGLDGTLTFRVRTYKRSGLPAFKDREFSTPYDLSGPNVFVQAYRHLKSLADYSSAADA